MSRSNQITGWIIALSTTFNACAKVQVDSRRAASVKQVIDSPTSGTPFSLRCDGDVAYAPGEIINFSCTPAADTKGSSFKIESSTCSSDLIEINGDTGVFSATTVPQNFEGCNVTVVTGDGNNWCPAGDSTCRYQFALFHLSLIGDFDKSGVASSDPFDFVSMNGKIYFFAVYNGTLNIFTTDGTASGTKSVARLFGSAYKNQGVIAIGSKIIFTYSTISTGTELWVSDGTQAGTHLVKDLNPGSGSSNIVNFTPLNGIAYFRAYVPTNGYELWRSDGTDAGTYMVKEINPGSSSGFTGTPTSINGALYFVGNDGVNGAEIWRSDGTADGTYLMKDINPGASGSSPSNFTKVNGRFFFTATDPTNGVELWKSDGTESSTILVKDIYAGSSSSSPSALVNLNGTLIFAASDGTNGTELWKSDGSSAGTTMISDIYAGSNSSYPYYLTQMGSHLYFQANDGIIGYELWRTDGSSVSLVAETASGATSGSPSNFNVAGSRLFWTGFSSANGTELWVYDSATAVDDAACVTRLGTGGLKSTAADGCFVMLGDIYLGTTTGVSSKPFTVSGNTVVFRGTTLEAGGELWKSDGTVSGTALLKDLNPTANSFPGSAVTKIGQNLFIGISDLNYGLEPRVLDLMSGSLSLLSDTVVGGGNGGFTGSFNYDGRLVWSTQSGQIWIYDPSVQAADTAACVAAMGSGFLKSLIGTGCLGPLVASNCCSSPSFMNMGGQLYFRAQLSGNGYEFWTSDGTQAGTKMVSIDASPGSYDSSPGYFNQFKGSAYISMNSRSGASSNGVELWKYDPTPAVDSAACTATLGAGFSKPSSGVAGCIGPYFEISGSSSRNPNYLAQDASYMYISANDATTGNELYRTDGSAGGMQLVADLVPGASSSSPIPAILFKGKLFFSAQGSSGGELYMYNPETASDDAACVARDGVGFVRALTSGCIGLFKEISPGVTSSGYQASSSPNNFVIMGDKLLFQATTIDTGSELWISDGTASGTLLLKDLNPGAGNSLIQNISIVGRYAFFTLYLPGYDYELWVSDGSPSGTRMVKEIYPGEGGSSFYSFTAIDNTLYFSANAPDGIGSEPWKLIAP